MSYPQNIRYGEPDRKDLSNPQKLFIDVKPSRITTKNGVPDGDDAEICHYVIDTQNNVLYYRDPEAGWQGIYQFTGGGTGDVTDGANLGTGFSVFKEKDNTILNFRTLTSIRDNPTDEAQIIITEAGQDLNELNLVVPSTVKNIINYGTISDYWIFDPADKQQDINGNYSWYAKSILGTLGIQTSTQTAGADKYIEIKNTGIVYIVNADENTGGKILQSVVNGEATLKNIKAGTGITITDTPSDITITATATEPAQSYYYSTQNNISYSVLNSFQNLPPFVAQLFSPDWEIYPNINGSSFFRYVGTSNNIVYKLNYNIFASATAQTITNNFIFRIAEGDPLLSQSGLALSGASLAVPASPSPVVWFGNCSTEFLFKPTVNQYYTLQASTTLPPQQTLAVEEIKINITKV